MSQVGFFCLIVSLFFSLAIPVFNKNFKTVKLYTFAQFIFITLSFLSLITCFIMDDLATSYVYSHSSKLLPWYYKACAAWGGHEGSMLLWLWILSLWSVAVAIFSKSLEDSILRAKILTILALLCVGFELFIIFTSNPFIQNFALIDMPGRDLNPLLQDPGFLFHPPILYMGYVGFAVPFAFTLAVLWHKRLQTNWIKWTRPWTLLSWSFLTLGITLGSWWAYRELGWGGWWFWDPVENASFMPWLAATALIHSLLVAQKRKAFVNWACLLSIIVFSLSLIGTFLVRSGVLTSVHSFAVDPMRGLYILGFLTVVIGFALSLFIFRVNELNTSSKQVAFFSRENALLFNNIFLIVLVATILLATLYPLIIDALNLGKISVGAPYFNTVFVPLFIPLAFLIGVGSNLKWQENSRITYFKTMLGLSVILAIALAVYFGFKIIIFVGLLLAIWIFVSTAKFLYSLNKITISKCAMALAHLGVAVTILGVCISKGYGVEEDVALSIGDSVNIAKYKISFIKLKEIAAKNYSGINAVLKVESQGAYKIINPQKRFYTVAKISSTDSDIDANLFRDIYVALGENLGNNTWSFRIYYKPFIRWIWGGGFMIFFGGILATFDKRYYTQTNKL